MRFSYSFGEKARQREDGQCVSVGPAGVTEAGALWASKEQNVVGKKAIIDRQPEQPGDVPQTWADVTKAGELFGYKPSTTFKEGVEQFVKWRSEQLCF